MVRNGLAHSVDDNLLLGGRFGDPVEGARVLDLFAGTGALALEALSRGAAEAVLVEDGRAGQRPHISTNRRRHVEDIHRRKRPVEGQLGRRAGLLLDPLRPDQHRYMKEGQAVAAVVPQ